MRLLFVTDTMSSGGAERVISVLTNKLCTEYEEIQIICLRKHLVFYDINTKTIELPRLWRSRGFLLHGLILSHESRITVLSPLNQRFIKFLL